MNVSILSTLTLCSVLVWCHCTHVSLPVFLCDVYSCQSCRIIQQSPGFVVKSRLLGYGKSLPDCRLFICSYSFESFFKGKSLAIPVLCYLDHKGKDKNLLMDINYSCISKLICWQMYYASDIVIPTAKWDYWELWPSIGDETCPNIGDEFFFDVVTDVTGTIRWHARARSIRSKW